MSSIKYRVSVQGTDSLGHKWLSNVVEVAKLGGEVDMNQLRTSFPHSAIMFLETDQEMVSRSGVTFTVLEQSYSTEEELDALPIEKWRKLMKANGCNSRNRHDGNTQYLAKFSVVEKVVKPVKNKVETVLQSDVVTEDVADATE